MGHRCEPCEAAIKELARGTTPSVGNEADAARIVLV
jgi:hypothetical protein